MNKKEATYQTKFNQYLRLTGLRGYFELKYISKKVKNFNYRLIEPHQIASLLAAQDTGFVFKLSDADPRIKPFDCISTPPLFSYVVLIFESRCFIIAIDDFLRERDTTGAKSLSLDRSFDICTKTVFL